MVKQTGRRKPAGTGRRSVRAAMRKDMVRCGNCAALVKAGTRFCPRCGARIGTGTPPWLAYLLCFLGGIVAVMVSALLEFVLFMGFNGIIGAALIAGFVEEPVKQAGVMFAAFRRDSYIRSLRVGAAGGAFAGLGFGLIEAIFYISSLSFYMPLPEATIFRSLLVLLHVFLSALAGVGVYFGARAGFSGKAKMVALIILAAGIHAMWNYAVLALF